MQMHCSPMHFIRRDSKFRKHGIKPRRPLGIGRKWWQATSFKRHPANIFVDTCVHHCAAVLQSDPRPQAWSHNMMVAGQHLFSLQVWQQHMKHDSLTEQPRKWWAGHFQNAMNSKNCASDASHVLCEVIAAIQLLTFIQCDLVGGSLFEFFAVPANGVSLTKNDSSLSIVPLLVTSLSKTSTRTSSKAAWESTSLSMLKNLTTSKACPADTPFL